MSANVLIINFSEPAKLKDIVVIPVGVEGGGCNVGVGGGVKYPGETGSLSRDSEEGSGDPGSTKWISSCSSSTGVGITLGSEILDFYGVENIERYCKSTLHNAVSYCYRYMFRV